MQLSAKAGDGGCEYTPKGINVSGIWPIRVPDVPSSTVCDDRGTANVAIIMGHTVAVTRRLVSS
jgi:hypothetical protein